MVDSSEDKKSKIYKNLESLTNEISQINLHMKTAMDILINKYNLSERQQEILYDNITKIVDVTAQNAKIPEDNYKLLSPIWSMIGSEYVQDVLCVFEKNKNVSLHKITDYGAKCYLNRLLETYAPDLSDSHKEEILFDLKESGLHTDNLPNFSKDE